MSELDLSSEDLRSARALMDWTQADLAKAAGVGVSTIAEFEKGARTPIANNLAAMRRALEAAGVQFLPMGPTIFSEMSLYLLTQTGGTEIRFRFARAAAASVQEIIGLFGVVDGAQIRLDAEQVATPGLKAAIEGALGKFGSAVPQLNKLKQIVGSLEDGEHFLLLPARPEATSERLAVERHLHHLNHPDEETSEDAGDELFAALLERYDFSSPRTDRRTIVGAGLSDRRCRFCDRTKADGATFKKAAHVIPTALGNDHLKSAEECDDCNEYFGCETEPSLIAMLDIQRVFLGTQGRGKNDGRPKLRFGEGVLAHDGSKVTIASRSVASDQAGTFTVGLGKGASLTPSAVYRALVKMVVSVVAAEELPALKKTIRWVRYGEQPAGVLPKVATETVYLPPDPSGQLTVYVRKQPHPRLPHVIGEFRLGCYMYVFAVPFSDQDDWNLIGFFEDEDFAATFKHYMLAAQWTHQDFNRQSKVDVMPQLKFVRRSV